MELKIVEIDGKTYAPVVDGRVLATDGEKTIDLDPIGLSSRVRALNGESMSHRRAREEAEARAARYSGIEDPEAALRALQTVQNLDAKKLIDAGEVDNIKASIAQSYEAKVSEISKRAEAAENRLRAELIGGAFARSKFVSEKLTIPAALLQSYYGARFEVGEDGNVMARDNRGNLIYSASGDPATFDEAIEILVKNDPHVKELMRGNGVKGTGAQGADGRGNTGEKTMTRTEFEALSPGDRANKMREGYKIVS
jgi:hypothetical protein